MASPVINIQADVSLKQGGKVGSTGQRKPFHIKKEELIINPLNPTGCKANYVARVVLSIF